MEETNNNEADIIYINGFYINMKATDLQINLYLNGQDVSLAVMSFVTAKNLANKLTAEIKRYEDILGVVIDDNDELQNKIDSFNEKLRAAEKEKDQQK